MLIREAQEQDFEAIWPIFHQIVKQGTTYAYAPETSRDEAFDLWMKLPKKTYVAELEGEIIGTYYLKANQTGLGSHVCNAGYMVSESAQGKGIGKAMCLHSQEQAMGLGFKAMQFNLVVSTNPAVQLWEKLGFEKIGCLPKAFQHQRLGYVDAFVMYKWLDLS
ncbi:MAG: GNAT family N-acetyltransferase [Trueperaceae bacterium]|nr:GNAT family N-acetyltransferase [Trueperaceae bacterium]